MKQERAGWDGGGAIATAPDPIAARVVQQALRGRPAAGDDGRYALAVRFLPPIA